jgi:hypothetical protein
MENARARIAITPTGTLVRISATVRLMLRSTRRSLLDEKDPSPRCTVSDRAAKERA